MKFGIGSYAFRYAIGTSAFQPDNPLTPVEFIEKANEFGVNFVQFAENLPLDSLNYQDLLLLKKRAKDLNITIEVGTAGAESNHLLKYLEICKALGASLLRITLHSEKVKPTLKEAQSVMLKVLPEFREAGVKIAIENHFTLSSRDLLSLIKEIDDPTIGVCLDTANSIARQEWPMETVSLLGGNSISLHLKDYQLAPHPEGIGVMASGVPLGEGNQDINSILKFLREHPIDMNVCLEQWMPQSTTIEETLEKEEEWIRKSVKEGNLFIDQLKV